MPADADARRRRAALVARRQGRRGHPGLLAVTGIVVAGLELDAYYTTLQRQSVIDALTGIPNRRSFSETILREFRRARRENLPLSMVMCDIDRFKEYNHRYGHEAGDECLRQVAQIIGDALERPGDFCARYGGAEFVVILSNMDHPGALHVAERIRVLVERAGIPHAATAGGLVTLSLGVATLGAEASVSNEDLIRRADRALYRAKARGRNRVEAEQESFVPA